MATKQKETAIQKWDEEMAKYASKASATAATAASGSKRIGTRAGFTIDGGKVPGNKLELVVIGQILENAYYEGAFDPDNPATPVCFAFGDDAKTMVPHPQSSKIQNPTCAGCPKNVYGSANTGKGKACKNQWRISAVTAGEGKTDPILAEKRTLTLPPTSAGYFTTYVKQLAELVKRPPFGVVTVFTWEADPKVQFTIKPEMKEEIKGAVIGKLLEAHEAEMKVIARPYDPPAAPKPVAKGNSAPKFAKAGAPAKGKRGR